MAYNGSGSFARLYSWVDDRDNGVKIRADRMDAEFDGIATGLSTAILKDGTQTITADIPWNGNKITGLGDPTSAQDAATKAYVDTLGGLTLANGDIFIVSGGAITNLAKGSDGDYLKLSSGVPAWTTETALSVSGSSIQKGDGAGGLTAAVADTDYVAVDGSLVSIGDLDLVAGDIIYASGTDTAARLAKGTDGQFLTLSSGVPAWADVSTGLTLIDSDSSFSGTPAASYSLTGLDAYSTIMIVIDGLNHNDVSNQNCVINFSDDALSSTRHTETLTTQVNTANNTYANILIFCNSDFPFVIYSSLSNSTTNDVISTTAANGREFGSLFEGQIDSIKIEFAAGSIDAGSIKVYAQ